MKKRRNIYLSLIAGIFIAFITAAIKGIFVRVETYLIMKDLSDAFLISAVIIGGAGLLTVCGAGGTFDMLSFSAKKFAGLFRLNPDRTVKGPDYYEFRKTKDEKRRPQWFLVSAGLFLLLLSVIFLLLYYKFTAG